MMNGKEKLTSIVGKEKADQYVGLVISIMEDQEAADILDVMAIEEA